ncbi:hypothetical protein MTO96_038947, partial [Rhipicephalus appendiculatus]
MRYVGQGRPRTHKQVYRDMHLSYACGGTVNGIKGPSALMNLEENLLSSFVTRCATLYGVAAATFNVHQILHLAENVRQLGPLWANSAFVFEGGNSKLVKSVTAAHGLPHQIVERVVMGQCLNNLIVSAQVTKQEQSLCLKFLGHKDILDAIEEDGVTLLGRARRARLTDTEINTLRNSSYDATAGKTPVNTETPGEASPQEECILGGTEEHIVGAEEHIAGAEERIAFASV